MAYLTKQVIKDTIEILEERVKDFSSEFSDAWIQEIQDSLSEDCNHYEIDSFYTKSGNPFLITFSESDFLPDPEGNMNILNEYKKTIEKFAEEHKEIYSAVDLLEIFHSDLELNQVFTDEQIEESGFDIFSDELRNLQHDTATCYSTKVTIDDVSAYYDSEFDVVIVEIYGNEWNFNASCFDGGDDGYHKFVSEFNDSTILLSDEDSAIYYKCINAIKAA